MTCPADDTIARFVDGELDASAAAVVRAHAGACSSCRVRVEEATADAAPPTRKADPLSVGSVLVGKYRVLAILGSGGMGVVVSALHEELGQKVAIKVLHDDSLDDGDSVKRFLREGRAAAKLQSDHAVRIYDVGRLPGGAPFLVMEHLVGEDLASLLRNGPLPADVAIDYVLQAIEAISEAHAHGLVHRDIKPANLFLTTLSSGDRRVKVLDFGLAKELRGFSTSSTESDLTTEHSFLGSPMFMSPEQIRDPRGVDKRTDIWSIGTTLWMLLTAEWPFSKSSVQTTLAEVCTKKLRPASSIQPGIPAFVDDVIARCTHKDPEGRFSTVEELAIALGGPRRRSSSRDVIAAAPRASASAPSMNVATADSGTVNPATPRMPDPAKRAFNRTEPMVAQAQAQVPMPAPSPRSAPTFVRPHPPPSPAPSRTAPPIGLAIVAVVAFLAIGALAVTQLRPKAATSGQPTPTPTPTPTPSPTPAPPPSETANTTPSAIATPSATTATTTPMPTATPTNVPPTAPIAKKKPPAPPTASGKPGDSKDPYDR